jgi:hypothetical protein
MHAEGIPFTSKQVVGYFSLWPQQEGEAAITADHRHPKLRVSRTIQSICRKPESDCILITK